MFYFKPKYGLPALFCLGIAFTAGALLLFGEKTVPVTGDVAEERFSVVVLDAGHGGADGGTVGRSGTTEKDINLKTVMEAKCFCDFLGVKTVLTRDSDISLGTGETLRQQKISDLKARAELVSGIEGAVFISVHQNFYNDFVSRGAQVFYSPQNALGGDLAVRMQAKLALYCDSSNKRKAQSNPNGNYLLENLKCPAIIVECGFLSHLEEEMWLNSPEYRSKLAFAIAAEALDCVTGGISAPAPK